MSSFIPELEPTAEQLQIEEKLERAFRTRDHDLMEAAVKEAGCTVMNVNHVWAKLVRERDALELARQRMSEISR